MTKNFNLTDIANDFRENFKSNSVILSYSDFLQKVAQQPQALIRNASAYMRDMFDYFGRSAASGRRRLFDISTASCQAIIGCEEVQTSLYTALTTFCAQERINKLILLHGANGAAKTSIVETIAAGLQQYSQQDDGCVYRFNWVFPNDPNPASSLKGEARRIGFGERGDSDAANSSYAYLDDSQISCNIPSEFRENPIYLLPVDIRVALLKKWLVKQGSNDVLPPHVYLSGLSKRNQLIFENLLNGYDGNLQAVYQHVRVERFYFSKQYRVGISTVEPQMSIDAGERQLTMERSITNLPPVLQNFNLHESFGSLVEANRGFIEFSDLLKRPVEAFKYLLATVETSVLNLPSGSVPLDMLFFATTNEKHLHAFKRSPDFDSFRERFHRITVSYLLDSTQEQQIYAHDLKMLASEISVAPHTMESLCKWAVMTRLRRPDPRNYDSKHEKLLAKLTPWDKLSLYNGEALTDRYSAAEAATLRNLCKKMRKEYVGSPLYEGSFGISPREVRALIYRTTQRRVGKALTVVAIFAELEALNADTSVYEFMQFERNGSFHDTGYFLQEIQQDFCKQFYEELLDAMNLINPKAYLELIATYVEHVAGESKKEKILDRTSGDLHPPSAKIMESFEKTIGISGDARTHRQTVLNRLAAFQLENPGKTVELKELFTDYVKKIRAFYFQEHQTRVWENFQTILTLEETGEADTDKHALAEETLRNLQERYGYSKEMVLELLPYLLKQQKYILT
ncbi:MAG: hypothetical protein OYH77_06755 [Pseudomonadota bacterium]|nr:hypothetical protein [Pseudomonadota bacterium]